jgi:ubiquinone/menaquinone biosynthesis C-methylase UbiE
MSNRGVNALKYFDILEAKKAYDEGSNITALLREQKNTKDNTSEIIEIAYDLQAGKYTEFAEQNKSYLSRYAEEISGLIQDHITPNDTLLDVGTGESTTLSFLVQRLATKPLHVFAFDISWSRIYKGIAFASKNMGDCFSRFTPFVGDISETPLLDKSINVTISNHALEPNGGRLPELLSEIFRVTRDKVILFEPCYEINTDEGKKRMDRLGYIKGVDFVVEALGGKLIEKIEIKNAINALNPTVCFVIEPPSQTVAQTSHLDPLNIFSVPGTNHSLEKVDDFFFSNTTGLCFPILKCIPVLKSNAVILSTALSTT